MSMSLLGAARKWSPFPVPAIRDAMASRTRLILASKILLGANLIVGGLNALTLFLLAAVRRARGRSSS
jgi:hypothetical protein